MLNEIEALDGDVSVAVMDTVTVPGVGQLMEVEKVVGVAKVQDGSVAVHW